MAYVLFAVQHPSHFRVMFGPHFPRPSPRAERPRGNAFGLLVQCLRRASRRGALRAGTPMALALAAWSLVHGLASLLVDRDAGASGGQVVDPEARATSRSRLVAWKRRPVSPS